MQSFNIDNKVKDREIIRIAIEKVCKSKKNKNKKKNRIDKKYKLLDYDSRKISWTESLINKFSKSINLEIDQKNITISPNNKSAEKRIYLIFLRSIS